MNAEWMHEPDQEGPVVGALDAQLDLQRWWRSREGQRFGAYFGESVASQMVTAAIDPNQEGLSPDQITEIVNRPETKVTIAHAMMAREIAQHEIDTLGRAATFYVTEEMVNEIGEAAAKIPDGLVIEPRMLPASHGFVVLASPLDAEDKHGLHFAVPAFSWGSDEGSSGVDFCSYSDPYDERDPHREELTGHGAHELMLLHIDGLPFGKTVGSHFGNAHVGMDDTGRPRRTLAAPVVQGMTTADLPGYLTRPYAEAEMGGEVEFVDGLGLRTSAIASARFAIKWLISFWTITNERLPVFHRVKIRQARRSAQRTLPDHPDECSIRVVDLRAYQYPDSDDHDPQERFWSHRWRVRGHWRTLHRGTAQERIVWVESYIKGPDDAPLIERDFIFRVRR